MEKKNTWKLSLVGGLVATLLGLIVMAGWIFNLPILIKLHATYPPMVFNTALGLFLSGITVILLRFNKRFALVPGLFLTIFFTLVIIEYIFLVNLGLDQIFIKVSNITDSSYTGSPAPNTAMTLVLIGFSIILYSLETRNNLINIICFLFVMIAIAISLVALFGYLFSLSTIYGWGKWTGMALHTSIGILFVSISLAFIYLENKNESLPIYLLPIIIVIAGSIFSLLFWQGLVVNEHKKIIQIVNEENKSVISMYKQILENYYNALNRMQHRLIQFNYLPEQDWNIDAANYLKNFSALEGIFLMRENNYTTLVSKDRGQEAAIYCYKNAKTEYFTLFRQTLCYRSKLKAPYDNLIAIISFPLIMDTVNAYNLEEGFGIRIIDDKLRTIYEKNNGEENLISGWASKIHVHYLGVNFEVILWPNTELINVYSNPILGFSFIMGLLLSTLLGIVTWGWQAVNISKKNLQLSESRFNSLIDNTQDYIIALLDENGFIKNVNKAVKDIMGYSQAELYGKSFSIFHLYNIEDPQKLLYDASINNKYYEQNWLKGKKEIKTYCDMIITPLYDRNHKLLGYSQIIKDLTALKSKEDQILALNRWFSIILEYSPVAIITTNTKGVIKVFNKSAEKLLHYRADEMIDKQTPGCFHDPQEVKLRADELTIHFGRKINPGFEVFVAALENQDVEQREWTYVAKGGKRIPVLLSVAALKNKKEQVVGYVGIAVDIEEKKEIEKMKNEFISVVSHELRTPLTSIAGSLSLLLHCGHALKETDKKLLNIALNNSQRLTRLINDILDIEKIESGKMRFNYQEVSLLKIITEAVELNRAYAEKFNVDLQFIPNSDDVCITADPDKMIQVLTNLISNAVKFSPKQGIVSISYNFNGTDKVRINVHDSGPGISDDFKDKIFSKFSQNDSSVARKFAGTGLGLNISKSIVEKHAGKIDFYNNDDGGSTFYFELHASMFKS